MATFRQTTSRADDPQLHTHAVISAKVQTVDGRWLALDARFLKRHQRMLGGLYQSVLRAELTHRYGVAWGPIVNGQAEIAGIPAELLEVFSKRTAQVDAALAGTIERVPGPGGPGPDPLGTGRHDPRSGRRHPRPQDRPAASRICGTGGGTKPGSSAGRPSVSSKVSPSQRTSARPAPTVTVEQVLDQLSTVGSTWTRADVMRAVCDLAPPRAGDLRDASGRRPWIASPTRCSGSA